MKSTKERIFEIADEIDAAGQNPTLLAVRKALGGGSYTTISDAMQDWKSRKAAKAIRPLAPPPSAVTDRLADLGTEIWSLAIEMANGQLAAERDAFEVARNGLVIEKQEAIELLNQVIEDLETAKRKIADNEAAERTAQADLLALREQTGVLSERAAAAEARISEARKRSDDLNAELARVNAQNTELVKALADFAKK